LSGGGPKLGRAALVALLAVAAQAAAAGADGPVVESATPDAVRPGDAMTLTGAGFRSRPADHRVFLGGGGAAVWADVLAATSDGLALEVGPVPEAGVETLTLWTGQGFDLPDAVLAAAGRTWLLTGASWFVAAGEAGFAPVTLLEPSPETAGGRLENGELRVAVPGAPDLPRCTPAEDGGFGCFEIEIKVVATTPVPEPPPATGFAERAPAAGAAGAPPAGPGVAASLSMRLMAGSPASDPAAFAADAARALERTFGSLGLEATAEGQEVVLAYGGGLGAGSAVVVARVPLDGSGP
jgi:hypothetical protein